MTRVNATRWQAHLEAAQAQGKALTEYAHEHGLSPYSLYAARKALRTGAQQDRSTHEATSPARSPFAAVQIAASMPALRAELPSAVVLHWSAHSTTDCALLIQTLAALRCSR
jgi:hypothetical protein